jgi:aminopeptidase N
MMELQKSEVQNLCLNQLQNSNNMTDCMAALGALANSESPQRHTALEWFYDKWKTEQLVIDKWFSVQAIATLPNTLSNVRELMKHPDFDIKNPNRVRSLIGAFCQGNHSHFNAADGSGYYFAAEQICAIDPLNSQIAARLARSFDRWRQFSRQHQSHAKEALLTIKTAKNLSKDTTEVVARALS